MIQKIMKIIQDLIISRFYGQLVLKFEAGKIVYCQKTETLKFDN